MRIGVAADHAGFDLKQRLAGELRAIGHEVIDFGAHRFAPQDDYPDFVIPLAEAVARGDVARGIVLCGSGIGACIAANKVAGARAGLAQDPFSARQGVADDDMNVLCLGAQTAAAALAGDLARAFLEARFSHAPRHERRLAKIAALESGRAPSPAQSPG